jgi:RHS repeat-associated protein
MDVYEPPCGMFMNISLQSGGMAYDYSNHGKNGTLNGSGVTWDEGYVSVFVPCDEPGNALVFDGSTNSVEVDNLDSADVTFATWVKFDNLNFVNLIQSANSGGWNVRMTAYYGVSFLTFSGVWSTLTLPADPGDGQWHFIAVSYDSTAEELTFYLDNRTQTIHNMNMIFDSRGGKYAIGSGLDGALDELGVWDRALSSTEIAALWNTGRGVYGDVSNENLPFHDGMMLDFHFDEGSGGTIYDYSGNGHNGRLEHDENYDPPTFFTSTAHPCANTIGFAGGYMDAETNNVQFRRRPYSPSLGGFPTPDPALTTNNLYAYCDDEPTNHNDPLGLWKITRDGKEKAEVESQAFDTIESLAKIIGLDPEQYDKWLTYYGNYLWIMDKQSIKKDGYFIMGKKGFYPTFELNPCRVQIKNKDLLVDDQLRPGMLFQVPNTVYAWWGGEYGNFGKGLVEWRTQIRYLSTLGFKVIDSDEAITKFVGDLPGLAFDKILHGIMVFSHGDFDQKTGAEKIVPSKKAAKKADHSYTYQAVSQGLYKLGLGIVNACWSNNGKFLISKYGLWDGADHVLNPIDGFPDILAKLIEYHKTKSEEPAWRDFVREEINTYGFDKTKYAWDVIKPGEEGTNEAAGIKFMRDRKNKK